MKENEESPAEQGRKRPSRHGFWFGIVAGGLLGVLLGGAVAVGAKVWAAPVLGAAGFHGSGFAGRHRDPELARERLEFATEWVFDRVDASSDQKARGKDVVTSTFDDLLPLLDGHRQGHEALVQEMTKVQLDPTAVEQIRLSQMELIDEASRELTASLTELAGILTPEQRVALVEMARRFHR